MFAILAGRWTDIAFNAYLALILCTSGALAGVVNAWVVTRRDRDRDR